MKLFRLSFAIVTLLVIAINRWMAFAAQLSMMFFIWNSLLVLIGVMSTIQTIVGFCFDVMKLTSGRKTLLSSRSSATLKDKNRGLQGYWQSRRKTYQEMVDNLYVKYMERLVGAQQQQAQYWNWDSQYIYPQSRCQNKNGDVYVEDGRNSEYYHQYANEYDYYDDELDNGEGSSDRNYDEMNSDEISEESSYTQDIKITEDTSITN
jgi:predicted membrane protein